MYQYKNKPKRLYLEGYIYFVTSSTFNRIEIFKDRKNCELFIKILLECVEKYKFELFGYVIMPDHIHLLIQPPDKITISECLHRIKGNFAYQYIKAQKFRADGMSRNHKGSATRGNNIFFTRKIQTPQRVGDPSWVTANRIRHQPIWQKSFYDHVIRNEQDFKEKLNYIHNNPIRAGLVKSADQYRYSSFNKYYT